MKAGVFLIRDPGERIHMQRHPLGGVFESSEDTATGFGMEFGWSVDLLYRRALGVLNAVFEMP